MSSTGLSDCFAVLTLLESFKEKTISRPRVMLVA